MSLVGVVFRDASAAKGGGCAESGGDRTIRVNAPFEMPELVVPSFAKHDFDIRDYGAVSGSKILNTKAFAKAITACASAGGGRVVVPAGRWLSGAIHLMSNVNLHLEEGAVVLFSTKPEDYLPVVLVRWAGFECYNYSPLIYARDCKNIAITGKGTLDGQGESWWYWFKMQRQAAGRLHEMAVKGIAVRERIFGMKEQLRPQFIQPINCENVLLEGFTVLSGPFWTVDLVYCENVVVRGLTVLTSGPNNDGINADSSKNVLIEHCFLETADDCVAIKSGVNEDGWRVGKPSENIVVRYCRIGCGHGGVVIGSDMSGGVRNVYAHDCEFRGNDRGIRIKSAPGRGATVENIYFENIRMENIHQDAIQFYMGYGSWFSGDDSNPPVYRNIYVRNVSCNGGGAAGVIESTQQRTLENVLLEDVTIRTKKGLKCEYARGLRFSKVNIIPYQEDSSILLRECEDVIIEKSKGAPDCESFVTLEGSSTERIRLRGNDLSMTKRAVVFGEGVPRDAVTIE